MKLRIKKAKYINCFGYFELLGGVKEQTLFRVEKKILFKWVSLQCNGWDIVYSKKEDAEIAMKELEARDKIYHYFKYWYSYPKINNY